MKKKIGILLCAIVLIALTGCGKENNIQISDLNFNNGKVTGEIKNLTDNRYRIYLNLLFKNGSIKENKECEVVVEANEKKSFSCSASGVNNYNVSIGSYELTTLRKPEVFKDESVINNYPQIELIVKKYMSSILANDLFSDYKFDSLTLRYEELASSQHYYEVIYRENIENTFYLYFDKKMNLENISLWKKENISASEKNVILNALSISENNFSGDELDKYYKVLSDEDYDNYPPLYATIINDTKYKGYRIKSANNDFELTNFKTTYIGLKYYLDIKYN